MQRATKTGVFLGDVILQIHHGVSPDLRNTNQMGNIVKVASKNIGERQFLCQTFFITNLKLPLFKEFHFLSLSEIQVSKNEVQNVQLSHVLINALNSTKKT